MGVQVDEPWRDDEAGGVELTRRGATHTTELDDDPVADRDVAAVARVERAVDDHAVANEHVEVGHRNLRVENERTIRPVDREPWPTIPAMLAAVAEEHADLPAVIDGDTTLTFPEFARQSLRVAGGLRRLGVQPGDRVAVWVPNVWQWAATVYGIWELGAIIVPIGTRYRGIEAASMLRRTEPRVLVGVRDLWGVDPLALLEPEIGPAGNGRRFHDLASVEHVVVVDGDRRRG